MYVEVSVGEAVDKYSILEIKKEKISSVTKNIDIEKELEALSACKEMISRYPFFYKLLVFINKMIWETTDRIKELQPTDADFSNLAHSIFEMNQARFRLKKCFNDLCASIIKEHKSYSESHCVIHIANEHELYAKIPEINHLCISYDTVSFEYSDLETIQRIFKNPNIVYNNISGSITTIKIESYFLPNIYRDVFCFDPLIYVCTGMLGDFVHQLSIINEKFIETGRRGKLYIYDATDPTYSNFTTGLANTYKDTYDIIIYQPYIESYHMIEENQFPHYDFNLSTWRGSELLYHKNWSIIFMSQYNVNWGSHKWLFLPVDDAWKNKIIISSSIKRFVNNINYTEICTKYKDDIIYVTQNKNEYTHFISKNDINIPLYIPTTLYEYWTIIHSCKKFIGNLSSPLAAAMALYKPVEIIIDKTDIDSIHMISLDTVIPSIEYVLN